MVVTGVITVVVTVLVTVVVTAVVTVVVTVVVTAVVTVIVTIVVTRISRPYGHGRSQDFRLGGATYMWVRDSGRYMAKSPLES